MKSCNKAIKAKKKHSYNKYWLRTDMDNMGYLFEYSYDMFLTAFRVKID